ncbi:MAG: CehA/McbA family metallohydrolase [Sandaracinus sp.]|nr:CehA/McbA family metallohydrolase [Sandaracinus sp.]
MRSFGVWVVLGLLAGCSGKGSSPLVEDAGTEDGGEDGGGGRTCEGPVPTLERPSGTAHAEPLGASATEARAGQLTADDLPDDPEGLLTWRAGDWVLANDHVAVVIEDARASDGYDPFGGKLAGMAAVEDGAMVRPADYNEIILGVGRYTVVPEVVGVHESAGDEAVIRVLGTLRPIPFADDLAAAVAPQNYDDLAVAVDYSLAPGANHVEVTLHLASERVGRTRADLLLLTFQTYRMTAFAPERGFDIPDTGIPFVGFADDDATSYAIEAIDDDLSLLLEVSGAVLFRGQTFEAAGCSVSDIPLARIHVGGEGMDGLLSAMREDAGTAEREITGTVTDGEGNPAVGVRVHAESADMARYLTRATTDAEGNYRLRVDASETDVRLRAFRVGEGIVEMAAGETDVTLPRLGAISVTATGAEGALPVRVQTAPQSAPEPSIARRWGEPDRPARRTHVVFPTDGQVTLPVLPGTHRVIVSRGFEYDLFESDVTVTAGETTNVPVMLERVVDTTGVMCADYHIHTNRSPDSEDPVRFKLHSAAGDGLEIPCRSDHEWVVSWDELVQEESLNEWIFGVTSLELTTFAWGHFGVVPLEPRPSEINNGAIVWADRTPPDVFAEVRARPEEPMLIINHPRGAAISGYFSAAGYDAATGSVRNPELWDDNFGAIETFNDSSFEQSAEQVEDWFSFLRSGRRVWAVGSSDTHHVMRGSPVGYPRTCLRVGMDDPEMLRDGGAQDLVRDATAAGHFTVSGGIYVDAWARGDVQPGDEVTSAMTRESVRVRVQAAPWIDVDVLEVYVDGELAQSIPIDASTEVVRFDESIEVEGDWVVFHAKGDQDLSPAIPGRMPFGVTQPIFFVR